MAHLYLSFVEVINILFLMIGDKYYRISEVSTITGLPKSLIRQWEREFPVIKPIRRGGCRYYSKRDLEIIMKLKQLIFDEKYSIDGAKEIILGKKRLPSHLTSTLDFLKDIVRELENLIMEVREIDTYGSGGEGEKDQEEL